MGCEAQNSGAQRLKLIQIIQVLDECNKQITDATGKQQGKIDELNSEIRLIIDY